MTTPNTKNNSHTNAPVLLPAPGWLFFWETLPSTDTANTPAALDGLVQLSLDSHAPLPTDQLAYGWRAFTSAAAPAAKPAPPPAAKPAASAKSAAPAAAPKSPKTTTTLLYYATARERLRETFNGNHDRATFILPDFLLAPDTAPDIWHWLATPSAITAVRFTAGQPLPVEIRSWALPEAAAETPLQVRAANARAMREPLCAGQHAPTLLWKGAALSGTKSILARWTTAGTETAREATFPVSEAWSADPRDRAWLARERKNRENRRRINAATYSVAAIWLLLAIAFGINIAYARHTRAEIARRDARQREVDAITTKNELIAKLDDMRDLEESVRQSFYDALAALNHYRPPEIMFSRAEADRKQPLQIHIMGTAAGVQQINSYIETLRKNTSFDKVDSPKITNTAGSTTFDFRVTLGKLAVDRSSPMQSEEEILAEIQSVLSEVGALTTPPATGGFQAPRTTPAPVRPPNLAPAAGAPQNGMPPPPPPQSGDDN